MSDIEELRQKNLCYHCIGEQFLSDLVKTNGKRRRCSYCQRTAKALTMEDIARRVETAFDQFYVRTSDQPDDFQYMMLRDRESSYEWDRDGEPVLWAIVGAADISEEVAQEIQELLEYEHSDFDLDAMGEETEFSADSHYESRARSDGLWQEEWAEFERSLKQEPRFFSRSGAAHLESVFQGIHDMFDIDNRRVVVDAGPGTEFSGFYRARAFQAEDRLLSAMCRPDLEVGSPPSHFAAAGRMNAQGISVFYGASDAKAAIAEVRPPVGCNVAVARFQITRPLKLLDLTAMVSVSEGGSIFDPSTAARIERATFLASLSSKITRPVMPDDQAFEYLPTQAIADYLATVMNPPVDGILFPSVQTEGDILNVVLFHKAARVARLDLPVGTEIFASTGEWYAEGWDQDYVVTEVTPEEPKEEEKIPESDPFGFPDFSRMAAMPYDYDADSREAALQIDLDSMEIHIIDKVEFKTSAQKVRRRRWSKG